METLVLETQSAWQVMGNVTYGPTENEKKTYPQIGNILRDGLILNFNSLEVVI